MSRVIVMCEFSFWSRRMPGEWRRLLVPTGTVPETIHLATDRETVLDFEAPTPDEGPLTVVRDSSD